MSTVTTLIKRDLNHIWHPGSQMKDFEGHPPLVVNHAKGSYLYTDQGPLIDGISSWWCKSLGHGEPRVISAIQHQLSLFEHVIGADTTHPLIVELAEQLADITGNQHVFFASDGSSAVEIAMKLSLQAMQIKGYPERNQFISLKNSYHGETLGTLAVSDVGVYKQPFESLNLTCHFLQHVPYVANKQDPLWASCEEAWSVTLAELEPIKANVCAVLVEPILQGAAGMRCYSSDFLRRLSAWTKANGIYLIADEIMTGLGRTGQWLACHHADIQADLICLSKGLTSGSLPLSCVLIDHPIYELFYDDYVTGKSFLHSHTYSGNALAVSAALATLNVMRDENINQKAQDLGDCMRYYFNDIAKKTGKLHRIRSIGAMVAGDFIDTHHPRIGDNVCHAARKRGALLRPIGNTLYWLPPLTTDHETIGKLAQSTLQSIEDIFN